MDRGMPGVESRYGRLVVGVRRDGATAVLSPEGELDHHTAPLLRTPLEESLDEGCHRLVVDCSGLDFCDSTGLNVLLTARLRAEAAGGAVHLAAMRPAVARVFEITGAGTVFSLHDDLDHALAELSGR
ncbi:STAS domain-containing protein [Streptomyces sp. TRM 70351]|uniref:STAS domain-containing protein n=1 Tax=Streptomyces sp. TRM 70351 TaxID=3116552 RepID=UPI002E7B32CD|nr:STAS domain-containing protein [Streptomyces sp. TRM 70351]MEE1929352.1 STAS domain-containing protein [Streptomyces sp. TRM 70351]